MSKIRNHNGLPPYDVYFISFVFIDIILIVDSLFVCTQLKLHKIKIIEKNNDGILNISMN